MKTHYNLEIKSPCSENFNDFTPTKNGGFCDSCHKEVIDFTKMKHKDIAKYFKTHATEKTCGKFATHQLQNTYTTTTTRNKYLSFFTGIGMSLLAFFSVFSAEAQELKHSKKATKNTAEIETLKHKNNITVKGTVIDEDGLPLPGANIILEGTSVGTQTNFDGYFEFPKQLKKGDVLVVSYVGYDAQKIIIENKKSASNISLKINMKYDSCMILGEVAVKEIFKSKDN